MEILSALVLLLVALVKFLTNRTHFQQFSKREWAHYILSVALGMMLAVLLILAGKKLLVAMTVEHGYMFYQLVIILCALIIGGLLFEKLMRAKVRI